MTTLEVLRGARELLSEPGSFCKSAQARDRQGNSVGYSHPDACSWCTVWATLKAAHGNNEASAAAIHALRAALGRDDLMSWSDSPSTKQEDVLALLDRAIAAESKAEGAES